MATNLAMHLNKFIFCDQAADMFPQMVTEQFVSTTV